MRLPTVMLALSQATTPARHYTIGTFHPSQQELLGLECQDCKIACEGLPDPEAVSACLEQCETACRYI